jgi:2-dehydro-3-deoxyphosphogluconate aldolase/(4S)-4-hydroxy-2-oxoglutarate aldolase
MAQMTERAAEAGVVSAFAEARIVAVVRLPDPEAAEAVARAAVAGGLRVVEVTADVPDCAAVLKHLADLGADVLIGAGTVTRPDQVDELVGAGARFVVSPWLSRPVLERAALAGVPAVPGAQTPTEAAAAVEAGAALVKVFPAAVVGPGWLRAVREVLPGLRAVPTGGIDDTNAATWLDAGATAVGVGGPLRAAWIRGGSAAVTALAGRLVAASHSGGPG